MTNIIIPLNSGTMGRKEMINGVSGDLEYITEKWQNILKHEKLKDCTTISNCDLEEIYYHIEEITKIL